jgi:hypothetical protein
LLLALLLNIMDPRLQLGTPVEMSFERHRYMEYHEASHANDNDDDDDYDDNNNRLDEIS